MNFLKLLPVLFSSLLMSAHFSRAVNDIFALLCLLLPFLLFVRRRWIARMFQILLLVGCVVWIETIWRIVQMRHLSGQPWGRLVVILGTVALFTALSALVFESKSLKERFNKEATLKSP